MKDVNLLAMLSIANKFNVDIGYSDHTLGIEVPIAAAALGEGFALGMANGVDLAVLYDAIQDSVGDSFVVRHDAPSIFAGHYDPSFTLDLCLKDLGLISELSSLLPSDLPMTEAAHEVFSRAAARYGNEAGELHVAKQIEDDTGISFRLEGEWVPPWEK